MYPSEQISAADSPIFLVGFMGAGKTTVGRVLARRLDFNFFDLDELIEARAGKSVQAIFAELGESEFRALEHELIKTFHDFKRAVIALGGGAYVAAENRAVLRAIGRTIWLDCPLDVCLRRFEGDSSRPLLGDHVAMKALFDQRRGAYSQADYLVRTEELFPEQVAAEIITLLDQ